MYDNLIKKKSKLAVIGLGYVGLPLALEFSKKISVIGFDISRKKIELLQQGIDGNKEFSKEDFQHRDIVFTDNCTTLKTACCFLIVVPTMIDEYNVPDLGPLRNASEMVGKILKKGDYVLFESTTYPGCTEEVCVPLLEKLSGLKAGKDFKFGYSPERINTGDKEHHLRNTVKVVAGCDEEAVQNIIHIYQMIVDTGIYKASSIKVAEASKIIENTQRDLNIALMNELSMIFDRIGINTYEVLEAAGTKWNFLKFQPGLVGGHCIGVDPYYLTYKAAAVGYESKVISSSRYINDDMAKYVARKIITHVLKNSNKPKVLVKGVTFKENVSDTRNSKIIDTVKEMLAFNIDVDIEDPFADPDEVFHQYGLHLVQQTSKDYDAVIVTIPHHQYKKLDDEFFSSITKKNALIADLKGIYRNKISNRKYWSL